jgi:tetratricopeptide (TPR) repeat protein
MRAFVVENDGVVAEEIQACSSFKFMSSSLLVGDLQSQIDRGKVVAIIGSGISISATNENALASWRGLLEHGVQRCIDLFGILPPGWKERRLGEIHSNDMDELLSAAEHVSRKLDAPNGGEYRRWLRESVGSLKVQHPEVIAALHSLGVKLATTNYDGLLEDVTGLPSVTWREGAKVERVIRGDEDGVLHLHGYWKQPESVVLGIRSYEQVLGNAHAQTILRALQTVNTLLFVGFGAGLKDPNFGELLRWTGTVFSSSEYRRFRLAKEDEVEVLQNEHPPEQRLSILKYGKDYGDLPLFLQKFSPTRLQPTPTILPESVSAVLPAPPRCFGRKRELDDLITELLQDNPQPLPILGPPGIGKTTISVAALHDLRVEQLYRERRYFVRCDGLKTREALAAQIGATVGLKFEPGSKIEPAVMAAFRGHRTILVIDNAETPWESDTLPVEDFLGQLASIPGLALVASLRGTQRPLGVDWRDSIEPPSLSRAAARETFLAISGQKFKNDARLDDLLRALDYVPLAVTLMAYAAEGEPNLEGIWKHWQRERTEMLRRPEGIGRLANVEVSYEISIKGPRMTEEGRRLLALMAYLPEGVTPEELEQICSMEGSYRAALVLRKAGLAFDESGRLRVLAPLREYVRRKHPPGEIDLKRLSEFYVNLAIVEGSRIRSKAGSEAIHRLAPQVANIDSVLLQGLKSNDPGPAIQGALALVDFTRFTGIGSSQALEDAALVAQRLGRAQTEAGCLKGLGDLSLGRADRKMALVRYERALALYQQATDPKGQADCLKGLGDVVLGRIDQETARTRYEQALKLYQQIGGSLGEADCICRLGSLALASGDYETARMRYEQALQIYRRTDDAFGEADSIKGLGDVEFGLGEHAAARSRYNQALPLFQKTAGVLGEANCLKSLGDLAVEGRDHPAARARYEQALQLYQQAAGVLGQANCICKFGDLALWHGDYEGSRMHYEQALTLYQQAGAIFGEANCNCSLAALARREGDYEGSRLYYERALTLYHQAGDASEEANCTSCLADLALGCGDHMTAQAHYELARKLYKNARNAFGEANSIKGLGDLALERGDYETAQAHYEGALTFYMEAGGLRGVANCTCSLGDVMLERGDYRGARQSYEHALPLYEELSDVLGKANCLKGLGDVGLGTDDNEAARAAYDQALTLFQQTGGIQGRANCIKGLGDVAFVGGDHETALACYNEALTLYQSLSDSYSLGLAHRQLARRARDRAKRKHHILEAKAAWQQIQRSDLVVKLESEFGDL